MDYFLIGVAALLRILPHPPNVTPVAAMALFGGAYLSRRFALAYPLFVMALSDILLGPLLGIPPFIPESVFVYGSFLVTGLLGLWCRSRRHVGMLYLASLIASIQFFLATNFGTWLVSGLYPRDVEGLLACYTMALPFFRNSLFGDLFWLTLLLGAYRLSHRLIPARLRV